MNPNQIKHHGFSLIEIMASMAIFSIILIVISQLASVSLQSWTSMADRQFQYRESRAAFDAITARLSTAELNPYFGFQYPNGDSSQSPIGYDLLSDLHFVSGPTEELLSGMESVTHGVFFHGSFGRTEQEELLGFGTLLNAWGYYIEFDDNSSELPTFLTSESDIEPKSRFRLKELQIPTEELTTFRSSELDADLNDLGEATDQNQLYYWFRDSITEENSVTLAENIIALIITPLSPIPDIDIAPNYFYDSRAKQLQSTPVSTEVVALTDHRLPPIVRITMVAISEQAAVEVEERNGSTVPDFGLSNLFQNVSNYDDDLETLEQTLQNDNINYRIFSDTVRLRNARWNQN